MLGVACFLLYLAIKKQFEPLLLLPIAFGMLLANLPIADLGLHYHDLSEFGTLFSQGKASLIDIMYLGVKGGIYPPLIFLGVGAMTDFGPADRQPQEPAAGRGGAAGHLHDLLSAPRCWAFPRQEAGSIGIIGGADGPTAIFVASKLLSSASRPWAQVPSLWRPTAIWPWFRSDSAAHHAGADHQKRAR